MKKIFRIFTILGILTIFVSCSSIKSSMKSMKDVLKDPNYYNNVTATFVTTQGEISFFLYPEAAPYTVANFINLAKRGYYDNTKFFRQVDNFMIQGGDPTETGLGQPGYTIPDEIVDWLDFYQHGMLAMANAGPHTGGAQFFITYSPADMLNGLHTIFGEVKSEADYLKVRKLERGDVIKEIKFSNNADTILSIYKDSVEEWNSILDAENTGLKKYPIKDIDYKEIEEYRQEVDKIYTRSKEKDESNFEYPTTKFIREVFNKAGNYTPRPSVISE